MMSDYYPFNLSDIVDIYVRFNRDVDLDQLFPPLTQVRDEKIILAAISRYTNHQMTVYHADFYDKIKIDVRTGNVYSKCLIVELGVKKIAEIFINSHQIGPNLPIVNYCWNRFCIVKEACQVIIRQEFLKEEKPYPAAAELGEVVSLYRNLVKYKFSISDFDNPDYPLNTKIENAAEILAILLLYPIDKMVADQAALPKADVDTAFLKSHRNIAERYRVPERFVELFLTSSELQRINAEVIMKTNRAW